MGDLQKSSYFSCKTLRTASPEGCGENLAKSNKNGTSFWTDSKLFSISSSVSSGKKYYTDYFEVWVKKMRQVQNLSISKKSTILVPFSWNLGKMITSWGDYFPQVS